MKVVVIGGAGVFGSRLARLLIEDGHDVVVAGRRAPVDLAQEIGAASLALDRGGDLTALWAQNPQAVIDAAGPFHAYGNDPYRLAREAIARGVHYLDLADDAAFCSGIVALDGAARDAGVIALSGASSVPALSSAIAADLIGDADTVDTITVAILPGNRAPRGTAVVDSILHQTGTEMAVTRDGTAAPLRSLSAPRTFRLIDGTTRRGYQIRVPDTVLFPEAFNAKTVRFFAGLELGVMGHGLAAWSWLRHKLRLGNPRWLLQAVLSVAKRLEPFGSDTGGMSVEVVVRDGPRWERRRWDLLVADGHGPFIPGVAARTILRQIATQASGAGPALQRFSRASAEDAMSDLATSFRRTTATIEPLFPQVVGPSFQDLPHIVQDSHATYGDRLWQGRSSVARGKGLWPQLIGAVFGFPKAGTDIPVAVLKAPEEGREVWIRNFGGRVFRSVLQPGPTGMSERFGALTFDLGLHVADAALHFPVKRGRIGPIPLPAVLLPRSVAREHAAEGKFHFDVALYAPITGQMIVHYKGTLSRSE